MITDNYPYLHCVIYGIVTTDDGDKTLAVIAEIPLMSGEKAKYIYGLACFTLILHNLYNVTITKVNYFFIGYCTNKAMGLQCLLWLTHKSWVPTKRVRLIPVIRQSTIIFTTYITNHDDSI